MKLSDDPGMMRIVFISSLDFTANGAAQNRQRQMIDELQAQGITVDLVTPQRKAPFGLPFPIATLPAWTRFLPRRLITPFWVCGAVWSRTARNDLVICLDRSPMTLLPALLVARLRRLRILHEITEYPAEVIAPNLRGKFTLFLFERLFLPRLDGILVISRALYAYVLPRAPKAKIFRIPAIAASSDKWSPSPDAVQAAQSVVAGPPFTFVYAGSLVERKDGVISLLHAFADAFSPHGGARLIILGYGSDAQKADVRKTIQAKGLSDMVNLHNPVPQADLPVWLQTADALVLCRPVSRQASYGFPTKLAEYLSTGRPAVVTQTSDIGHYLRDGVSAFLVPPDDIAAFAAALRRAASNPLAAAQIGSAGQAVFQDAFEVSQAVGLLADWLRAEFETSKKAV